jgi:hypothetical protein
MPIEVSNLSALSLPCFPLIIPITPRDIYINPGNIARKPAHPYFVIKGLSYDVAQPSDILMAIDVKGSRQEEVSDEYAYMRIHVCPKISENIKCHMRYPVRCVSKKFWNKKARYLLWYLALKLL